MEFVLLWMLTVSLSQEINALNASQASLFWIIVALSRITIVKLTVMMDHALNAFLLVSLMIREDANQNKMDAFTKLEDVNTVLYLSFTIKLPQAVWFVTVWKLTQLDVHVALALLFSLTTKTVHFPTAETYKIMLVYSATMDSTWSKEFSVKLTAPTASTMMKMETVNSAKPV